MSKDDYEGHHFVSKFLIITGITIAFVVFFTNLITKKQEERNKTLARERELAMEVQKLEKDNSVLFKKHNALLTDPMQIERYAREQLNYIAPGEKGYDKLKFKIIPKNRGIESEDLEIAKRSRLEGHFPWQIPALIILISSAAFYITYLLEDHRYENKVIDKTKK